MSVRHLLGVSTESFRLLSATKTSETKPVKEIALDVKTG